MNKCTIRIYDESTGELLQKQCSKCGLIKSVSEFCKNKKHSDGLMSNCKSCKKESIKKRREANPDKIKDKRKEYMRERRKIDKYKEYRKKRYEANKEHYKEYKKEWRQTPGGKAASRRKSHKRRALKKANGGTWTLDEWNQCLQYFEYKDAYTGEPLESTEMEHVIPLSKGGTNNIYNLVPANKSTNCSKHNSDVFEWYSQQPYFSWERYLKICLWIIKNGGAIE